MPLSYIRDFLGHESIDTVWIYAYADSETIEEALRKVSHERNNSESEKNGRAEKVNCYSIAASSKIYYLKSLGNKVLIFWQKPKDLR